MKLFKHIAFIALFIILFSFNVYAMPQNFNSYEPKPPTPSMDEDYQYGYRWTWLNDDVCAQFKTGGPVTAGVSKSIFGEMLHDGLLYTWYEDGHIKIRDTYSGKWSQDENGKWSFVFDDDTIPIDLTKIDGVLYAFNDYGELVDGYEYWNGQKTGPDGVATCTDPEFVTYLGTQYLPDCTSHK